MTASLFGKGTKPVAGTQAHPEVNPVKKSDETYDANDLPKIPRKVPEDLVETLTMAQVREAVPAHLMHSITQELVDTINAVSHDPLLGSIIRENFLGYTKVLAEGRFKLEDYLSAVKYVTFKLMGYSNEESWSRAFPNRYQILLERGTTKKDISSHVAAYHKNRLVSLIMEQAIMPTWVVNQDYYQRALQTQFELMTDQTQSGKVRTEAANSLLVALQKPKEAAKFQVNVAVENSGMKEMREMMQQLAAQQQGMIIEGKASTVEIAQAKLVPKPQAPKVERYGED